MAPEDSSKPVQTVTIEPDPTLAPNKALIAAKTLFGAAKGPVPMAARSIGSYARGCLAGAVALPVDGPAWQAMRLSRNRNWGHPKLINLVERLATDAQKLDGWPGLLVGDISQPRGGPMLTGHASHQVGLDADVWLTPMPDHTLTNKEREEINATSMLDATDIAVDKKIFTDAQVKLIKRAASYPEVERVLVHPAIKKALCEAAGTDRKWLGKVRPIGGHYYHFHIRIACPPGSATCAPQQPPTGEDGCGKEVQEWLARLTPSKTPPPPKPPGYKPPPPAAPITLAQLPQECTAVLETGPDGVPVPAEAKADLRKIAHAPASLRPRRRKLSSAGK
jgi:penicillin-insensitive murein endopeptidase